MKDIEADTVVADLKTKNNKLSVWAVETDEDLNNAFIALGSNCQNLCSIWAVKIAPSDLDEFSIDEEEGDTPTNGINQNHRNITELTYISLGYVITSLLHSLQTNLVVKKTKTEMKSLLYEAYRDGKINVEALSPGVYKEIKKYQSNI